MGVSLCLASRKENRLRMPGNRVLRRIFEPTREYRRQEAGENFIMRSYVIR
jgi:hypothetical protein